MAIFKKTCAYALTPLLCGNKNILFANKTFNLIPNEFRDLSTGIIFDVPENLEVGVYNISSLQIAYAKRESCKIPFHNSTCETIVIERGTAIGYVVIYEKVDLELENVVDGNTFGFRKLISNALNPIKIDGSYEILSPNDHRLLPNESVELGSGLVIQMPQNCFVRFIGRRGKVLYESGEEVKLLYRNESAVSRRVRRGDFIARAEFFMTSNIQELEITDAFSGERKIEIDERKPCTTNDLFKWESINKP